jgi:hypothetical protein
MFEKCNSTRGSTVSPDGFHERVLCEKHAGQVGEALDRHSQTLRVSWGRWTQEIVAELESELDPLFPEFGEPDWPDLWPPEASLAELLLEPGVEEPIEPIPARQESGWNRIDEIRGRIDSAWERPSDEPVVRITLRTR